jgi:hypothetical protein
MSVATALMRAQTRPERPQGSDPLAVADVDHGATAQVQDQRQVAMALAHGHLVDGDLLETAQLGLAETPPQVAGLDVLDGVPTDAEMLGDVLDGHVPAQFQGVALEGASVAAAGFGEGHLDLADVAAGEAQHARHREAQEGGPLADGQGAEGAFLAALGPDVGRAADGTAEALAGLLDGEGHAALLEMATEVAVALQTEGVVD